jgi:hypothetical protein
MGNAAPSPEFTSLAATRGHLLKSIAHREGHVGVTDDFKIGTEKEKGRLAQIEERMGEIDADALKAIQAAETAAKQAQTEAAE